MSFGEECKKVSKKFKEIDDFELEKSKRIRKCLQNIKKLYKKKKNKER